VRLDLRAVGSRASGQAAKEEEVLLCLGALEERHEDRALRATATEIRATIMPQQRVGPHGARLTNAHLRNVQPSFQQDIACRLRDVAVSTHMSLKNRSKSRARSNEATSNVSGFLDDLDERRTASRFAGSIEVSDA